MLSKAQLISLGLDVHCYGCGRELDGSQDFAWREGKHRPYCTRFCLEQQRKVIKPLACCAKAQAIPCVCIDAYRCPVHGETHRGTHD